MVVGRRAGTRPNSGHGSARLILRAALALVVTVGAVHVATQQEGFVAQGVELGTGSVWVSSTGPGQLALLDGAGAAVTVRVAVSAAGDDVVAAQSPTAGYAVNRSRGTVTRVDSATWQYASAQVLAGSSAGLAAVATDHSLFVTDTGRGLVARVDPRSLAPIGEEQSLSAAGGSSAPVVDHSGTLWLLDSRNGDVIRMVDVPRRAPSGATDPAAARLVLANGIPVVVDLAGRTAITVDRESGEATGDFACLDTDPADRTVTAAGSTSRPEVYAVSGRDGVLRITDLTGDDSCHDSISVSPPGSDLGDPVESARHLYIPDYTTGQVLVVDLDDRTIVATPAVTDPGERFDLIGRDGFVFYNDRASDKAGVVTTDGSVRSVAKYDVDDPSKGLYDPAATPTNPVGEGQRPDIAPTVSTSDAPSEPAGAPGTNQTPGTDGPVGSPRPEPVPTGPTTSSRPPPPPTTPALPSPPPPVEPTVGQSAASSAAPSSAAPPSFTPSSSTPSSSTPSTSVSVPSSTSPPPQPPTDLSVSISGEGTVGDGAAVSCTSSCNTSIDQGTAVTLTATPASGWVFAGWSGDCTGTGSCPMTMDSGHSVTATFTKTRTLTLTAPPGARVTGTGIDCPGDCTESFGERTTVVLTLLIDDDRQLTGWTGGCTGTASSCQADVDGAVAVGLDLVAQSPVPVAVANATAPQVNHIWDGDGTITVSDSSTDIRLNGTTGSGFLQSRTFPVGEPGTPAAGLYATEWRVALDDLRNGTSSPCVKQFSVDAGPAISLDYDFDGHAEPLFQVTGGAIGDVALESVTRYGDWLRVVFVGAGVCAGSGSLDGQTSYFIGLTSQFAAGPGAAYLVDSAGVRYDLAVRAPARP